MVSAAGRPADRVTEGVTERVTENQNRILAGIATNPAISARELAELFKTVPHKYLTGLLNQANKISDMN